MNNNMCLNEFTDETFMESFGNDETTKKCEKCPNFIYESGTLICKKFNSNENN